MYIVSRFVLHTTYAHLSGSWKFCLDQLLEFWKIWKKHFWIMRHLDNLLGQGQVHLGRNWLLQFSTFSLKIFERKGLILFLMKWDLFLICSGGERKCWMNLSRAVGFVSIFTAVAFYAIFSKHSALMPFYIISESLQGRSIQEVITNLLYQFQHPYQPSYRMSETPWSKKFSNFAVGLTFYALQNDFWNFTPKLKYDTLE